MNTNKGKKLSNVEHLLLRPDTIIGSIRNSETECWVYDEESKRIITKLITYNPGLERLFIEIMSNVEDNKWRSEKAGIKMTNIEVTTDDVNGEIIFKNNGSHIPIELTQYEFTDDKTQKVIVEEMYPAELFFSEFRAGTNFVDDQERKTSGKNGYGSKATNVFSKRFDILHSDPNHKLLYHQTFTNNSKSRTKPEVSPYFGEAFTQISFIPDYERFGYPGMDDTFISLIKRHLYECSMVTGLPVKFNGEKLYVKNLEDYSKLFFPQSNTILFKSELGDECVVVEHPEEESMEANSVKHVSFVNGIYTKDGGIHVDNWSEKIFRFLVDEFNKRKVKKGEPLKTTRKQLMPYFTIFVRCELPGPEFKSQTKDQLTGPNYSLLTNPNDPKHFNEYIRETVTKMLKWKFVNVLESKLSFLNESAAARKEKRGTKIPLGKKAEDANYAGKKGYAMNCTLYITEGLSAKTFATKLVSKLENGPDYYGTFALKGKFINVHNATVQEINNNEEVKLLKQVLGLITNVDYSIDDNFNKLRYGKVCILTDADDDGIHIRGLVLNFFFRMWPSLFYRSPAFCTSMSTAVTMIKLPKEKLPIMFYSNPSFKNWLEVNTLPKSVQPQYYKGLGTHEGNEYELYLNDPKIIDYLLDGQEEDYMNLGFDDEKGCSDWRKEWMLQYIKTEATSLQEYTYEGFMSLSAFVSEHLIIYHRMTLRRALPCMYDGFKESQRKIIYGIFNSSECRKEKIDLETIVGIIKKATRYHHGGVSMSSAIVKLAQGYIGSNNIPLLKNCGEFGTRWNGGKDAAAPRYIKTQPEDISEYIFRKEDEPLYEVVNEDGKEVEYRFYMPILPMVLINGASGMASGWSTEIPCFNPHDIINWINHYLAAPDHLDQLPKLTPWYRGFTGKIELTKNGWKSVGILEQCTTPKGWWDIKECPIGVWPVNIKMYIEQLESGEIGEGEKKKVCKKFIVDKKKMKSTTNSIHYRIKPSDEFLPDIDTPNNFKILQRNYSLKNIVVLDEHDYPHRYDSVESLLSDFCKKRLEFYVKRKEYWLNYYKNEIIVDQYKLRFLEMFIRKEITVDDLNQEDEVVEMMLLSHNFVKIDNSFDYILSMGLKSLTLRRLENIRKDIKKVQDKIDELEKKDIKNIWLDELSDFEKAYNKFLKTRNDDEKLKE